MKIFGSADTMNLEISTVAKSRKQMVYGAWVGMENFYRAIIEHGTFDEYHFFSDTKMHADLLRKKISRLNANRNKIKIIDLNKLPSCLQNTKYTVFFTCGADLSLCAYLRNKYANPPFFPVCGIVFQTISYAELLKKDFFYNALTDLYPFDSIISASSAVEKP